VAELHATLDRVPVRPPRAPLRPRVRRAAGRGS